MVSSAVFSAWLTWSRVCSTRSAVSATGRHRDFGRVGADSGRPAALIAFGMVAEKNRVWRFAGTKADDPLQRMDEAEVEHLVGLVEDEDFELATGRARAGRRGRAGGRAWRRARRGRATTVRTLLPLGTPPKMTPTDSRMNCAIGVAPMAAICAASSRVGASTSMRIWPGLGMLRGGGQAVERRQHEGRGLAGAGLGDAEQVAAGQDGRDGLRLDRRRPAYNSSPQARRAGAWKARGR